MSSPGRTLVLGAGPTGLGAAWRLAEMGHRDFLLLEGRPDPGGLASSFRDGHGFTWDVGGHVQFSHYAYYDAVLDRALGDAWLTHEREAWVWIKGRFVPYPFQENLHRLDPDDAAAALRGLEAAAATAGPPPAHFEQWIVRTFGGWIAGEFLWPYNRKVWGHPLDTIGIGWMGERVAVPDLDRVRRSLRTGEDQVSWGPNRTFRFPRVGGTGAIWRGVARLLPDDRLRFGATVSSIDLARRQVVLADGVTLHYDTLVSSLPLDRLCATARGLARDAQDAAASLVKSAVHVIGVGLAGEPPATLRKKCWMYFPEDRSPYYRVTVFSNYSPANAPDGCWSLMAEVCETPHRPVDAESLPRRVVDALIADGLLSAGTPVVSLWHRREGHGYPTPFLGRDAALARIRPELERHRVFSRGRFGAWLYEVSNQDHSFMQGVELADRLLDLGVEDTLDRPDLVNGGAYRSVPSQRPAP
ncbi:MAG TPA: FAD-dependent oxidoreductase [Vicinamibacteria bacterium]|nr:FAD-dependent oxidoreductase [Vicinamibacteria bacterium]